jgi:hypothetical protein
MNPVFANFSYYFMWCNVGVTSFVYSLQNIIRWMHGGESDKVCTYFGIVNRC